MRAALGVLDVTVLGYDIFCQNNKYYIFIQVTKVTSMALLFFSMQCWSASAGRGIVHMASMVMVC